MARKSAAGTPQPELPRLPPDSQAMLPPTTSPAERRSASPSRPKASSKKSSKKAKSASESWAPVKENDIFDLPASDWQIAALITVIAFAVRLFRIYQPSSVVFDEVHFGGFASKYIKGRFFMDVHPPLAKLLLTLAGWLAGYDGDFDFKEIGKDYLAPGVPYVAMRLLPALMGVMTVPVMFMILKAAGCGSLAATLGGLLVCFENGLVTQSRLILLDSPLVGFTSLTVLCWISFQNQHEQGPAQAFNPNWWFWLISTGLALGATASVKWVGLFTIAWVGTITLVQLWNLWGDVKHVNFNTWVKHLLARALCLIVIPVLFYMGMFAIHFVCLVNPGDGDGFMSSEFQSTLNSKQMSDVPADVAFGSRVSIRHWNTQGGYLHSHNHMYPTGSKQQQITLYPHKDENNVFVMENQTIGTGSGISGFDDLPPVFVEDGAVIRLYHTPTHRRIHSHDVRPPITEADWQNEVSAYGYEGFEGDANDFFRVEIVKSHCSGPPESRTRLRTIQTKFKLVHQMTGCVLFSHKVKLPDWGYEQQEVTCARGATLPNSIWYVEYNQHPMLAETAEKVNYARPGFFGKFIELNKVMWRTNAGLVESHAWDSRPPSWPWLRRGINFWGKDNRQIYLMGNPIVWWSSAAALIIYVIFKGISILRWQRGFADYNQENFRRFDFEVGMTVIGWAFHYFPFFLMQRQLFLHHYFPALYFGIIAFCQIWDFFFNRMRSYGMGAKASAGMITTVVFLTLTIVAFGIYSPLAYANPWTKSRCNQSKILGTWDWDCNVFHDTYAQYATQTTVAGDAMPTNAASVSAVEQAAPQEPVVQQEAKQVVMESPSISGAVTQAASWDGAIGESIVSREEMVEYRDQDGNLLDEEAVKALGENVQFETKYETKTRMIDQYGNEIQGSEVPVGTVGLAPEPDTPEVPIGTEGKSEPVSAEVNNKSRRMDAETGPPPPSPEEESGASATVDPSNPTTTEATAVATETEVVYIDPDDPNIPEHIRASLAAQEAAETVSVTVTEVVSETPGLPTESLVSETVYETVLQSVDQFGKPITESIASVTETATVVVDNEGNTHTESAVTVTQTSVVSVDQSGKKLTQPVVSETVTETTVASETVTNTATQSIIPPEDDDDDEPKTVRDEL